MKYILILLMTFGFAYGQQDSATPKVEPEEIITSETGTTVHTLGHIVPSKTFNCGVPKSYREVSEWEIISAGLNWCPRFGAPHLYAYKEKEMIPGFNAVIAIYIPCPTNDTTEEEYRICKKCGYHERRTIKTGIRYIPKEKTEYELVVEKFKP